MKKFLAIGFILLMPFIAQPQSLSEQAIEQRAHSISKALRCVVCQNQSIDASDAPLAADMRRLVRKRIRLGESDRQVIEYMRERYGDFVLLKPPLQANTYILWFAPGGILLMVLVWYVLRARQRRPEIEINPLSLQEQKQFDALEAKTDGAQ